MSNEIIKVGNYNLPVKEYQGMRVVTLKDVDLCHKRAEGTARRNFNQIKERVIEGTDYFKISANEIRTRKICEISPRATEDVTLLTESGYLMLVKSLTDDLAWDADDELSHRVEYVYYGRKMGIAKALTVIYGGCWMKRLLDGDYDAD